MRQDDTYRKRYKDASAQLKNLDKAAEWARLNGGCLSLGFCQTKETLSQQPGAEGGACYALVVRWFRGKYRQESEGNFHKWLLPGSSSSSSDPKSRDALAPRWQLKQDFGRTLGKRVNQSENKKSAAEVFEDMKLSGEATSLPDKASKYVLGTSQDFFTSLESPDDNLVMSEWSSAFRFVAPDLMRQLAIRKIVKNAPSKATNKFNDLSRSKNYYFRIEDEDEDESISEREDPQRYAKALDIIEQGFKQILTDCANNSSFKDTNLFILLNLYEGGGAHCIGINYVIYGSPLRSGYAEVFDPNLGLFTFEGERDDRKRHLASFVVQLLKLFYKEYKGIQFIVLARS